ncbi:hypothetical protein VNI00_004327 [Paramarasmius palmivorus]|uniref:F-box domain-containing protein n=1 Tax=Paramarasmius palmivorus TaxID=297713 RepID=A0AAW0DKB5_9AGAR
MRNIFGYLEPPELLRLARTSRDLRSILMSRSSTCVWKTSRQNAGIPDPVPSLSEPAFADLLSNLLFLQHDQGTSDQLDRGSKVLQEMRAALVRLRDPATVFVSLIIIYSFASAKELKECGYELDEAVWNFVVPSYRLPPDLARFEWRGVATVYLMTAVKALFKKALSLPMDNGTFTAFLSNTKRERDTELQQIHACQLWDYQQNLVKSLERMNAREERKTMIIGKLQELGWREELTHGSSQDELIRHKLVNQPRVLTDRSWRNICATLEAFMSSLKTDRLSQERTHLLRTRDEFLQKMLRHYAKRLPHALYMPPLPDIVLWGPFRWIIEDTPSHVKLQAHHFSEPMKQLPAFIEQWNAERHNKALVALQKHVPQATSSDLNLAISLFCCKSYRAVWSYPGIMAHMCGGMADHESERVEWCSGTRSSYCEIEMATEAIDVTRVICNLYGLDPKTTSLETLMTLNPLVECKTCSRYEHYEARCFKRWTQAATHCRGHELLVVSKIDEAVVVAKESQQDCRWYQAQEWYRCKECDYKYRLKSVRKHLQKVHQIEDNLDNHIEYTPLGRLLESTGPSVTKIYPPGTREPPAMPILPWDPDSDSD